jgi:hypothetical protein
MFEIIREYSRIFETFGMFGMFEMFGMFGIFEKFFSMMLADDQIFDLHFGEGSSGSREGLQARARLALVIQY